LFSLTHSPSSDVTTGIPMDSTTIHTLRHRLQKYDTAVRNHQLCFMDQNLTGELPAYAPYYERHHTLACINALASEERDIPAVLWQEYARITHQFGEFEQNSGPAFRKLLLSELLQLTQVYQAALCYAFLGSPLDPSTRHPAEREIISVLLAELKKDHNLLELERLIRSLDENVASIAENLHEVLPEMNAHTLNTDRTPARCDKGMP
jgi:hypothetical protein